MTRKIMPKNTPLRGKLTEEMAVVLIDSAVRENILKTLTNRQMADYLLAMWGYLPLFSDKSDFLNEVIDRLLKRPKKKGSK